MTAGLQSQEIDQLFISVFRLNGALLAAGDALTQAHGITSARWQVLGALSINARAMTMPQIADYMGLTRQAVIKQVKLLVADGFIAAQHNAAHKRSDLWLLTPLGAAKYGEVMQAQRLLLQSWREGVSDEEVQLCTRILQTLSASVQRASVQCASVQCASDAADIASAMHHPNKKEVQT